MKTTILNLMIVAFIGLSTLHVHANNKSAKVAILGAGLSGLTSLYTLLDESNGSIPVENIKVYEATQRIGGQVHTLTDPFCHGYKVAIKGELLSTAHTDYRDFVQNILGINLVAPAWDLDINWSSYFFKSKGVVADTAVIASVFPANDKDTYKMQVLKKLALHTKTFKDQKYGPQNKKTLMNYLSSKKVSAFDYLKKELNAHQELIDFFQARVVWLFGRELNQLSAKYIIENTEITFDDPNTTDDESYIEYVYHINDDGWSVDDGDTQKIITVLKAKISQLVAKQTGLSGPALDKKLNKLFLLNNYVNGIAQSGQSRVQIGSYNKLTHKSSYKKFDHVISTLPLHVLRSKNMKLEIKGLDSATQFAIKNHQYANIAQIFLLFDKKPWAEKDHNENGKEHSGIITADGGWTTWESAHTANLITDHSVLRVYLGGQEAEKVIKFGEQGKLKSLRWGKKSEVCGGEALTYGGNDEESQLVEKYLEQVNKVFPTAKARFKSAGSKYFITLAPNAYPDSARPGRVVVGEQELKPHKNRIFFAGSFQIDEEVNPLTGKRDANPGYMDAAFSTGRKASRSLLKVLR